MLRLSMYYVLAPGTKSLFLSTCIFMHFQIVRKFVKLLGLQRISAIAIKVQVHPYKRNDAKAKCE